MKPARFASWLPWLPLPLVFLAFVWWVADVKGPLWLGINFDPGYQYLFHGTILADLEIPPAFQHPGIPLVILNAATIALGRLLWIPVDGWDTNLASAVRHHEGYQSAVAWLCALLIAALLLFGGRRIYRLTGSVVPALAFQASIFLSYLGLQQVYQVANEPLELAFGLALVCALAPMTLGSDTEREAQRPGRAIAAGILTACGIAAKYNFLLVGGLLLLFSGIRQKLRAALAGAATLLLLLVPPMTHLGGLREFLDRNFGQMETNTSAGVNFWSNYWNLTKGALTVDPVLGWLALLYAFIALTAGPRLRRFPPWRSALHLMWLAPILMVLHLTLTAARLRPHYLVPVVVMTFIASPHAAAILRQAPMNRWLRACLATAALSVAAVGLRDVWRVIPGWADWTLARRHELARLMEVRSRMPDCEVIGYYRASTAMYALGWGHQFGRYRYGSELERLYPGELRFNQWALNFVDWSGNPRWHEVEQRASSGECILIQGEQVNRHMLPGFQLHPVYLRDTGVPMDEGLYRLSLDARNPALIPGESSFVGARILDAASYANGDLGGARPFAEYRYDAGSRTRHVIRVRYAAEDSRPIRVLINGSLVFSDACKVPTGGTGPAHFRWHDLGIHPFRQGENTIRLERDGSFPVLKSLAIGSVPD